MGHVVAACGQGHVMFDNKGIEAQSDRVFDGFKAIGEHVRAAKPDVLIIISGDHMFNVSTPIQVPLAVAVGDTHVPFGDMEIPTTPFKGHRDFAEGFVRFAAGRGFDLGKLEEEGFRPDHGYSLPAMFLNPDGSIPTVPINANINMNPAPSLQRCYDLGTVLREYIERQRPADERVAVIASGGISHWLMIERDGEINEDWDRHVIELFEAGRATELLSKSLEEIVEVSGNGGTEIMFWMMMLGTVPGAKGKQVFYEPVYQWKTGLAGVEMQL